MEPLDLIAESRDMDSDCLDESTERAERAELSIGALDDSPTPKRAGDDSGVHIDAELRADAAHRLRCAILAMEGFLRREECQTSGDRDPTRRIGQALINEGRHLLRGDLAESRASIRESTLRSAYRLTGALGTLASWSAPASQESHALNSFPVAAARDGVAYSRYGCAEITEQELIYLTMLGFDPGHSRLLLTSSGMTAYALIEAFLVRAVLQPNDFVLLHPSMYFETRQQVKSLPYLRVQTARGGGRRDMLADIVTFKPRVVFVDPLSNSAAFRAIDMNRLLDEADAVCERETWFVIDSTLLSGAFDPFAGPPRRQARVLYYESGCKYLQFGMDLGPAGLVVVDSALAQRFESLRRGIGAIGSDGLVLPRSSRAAYLGYLELQTICAQTVAQAVTDAAAATGTPPIEAQFPSQRSHPDYAEAKRYPHLGGVLVFRFSDPRLNRRKPLEDFIDRVMTEARVATLPLTSGVSFGFRIPRIGAAWSSYDAEDAFLRLSAGMDRELAGHLGRLIVRCAEEFIRSAPH